MDPRKKQILIHWLIAGGIFLVLFLICYLAMGLPRNGLWYYDYNLYSDSFLIPGVILVGFSLLLWIGRQGVFDVLRYGFYRLFESYRKGMEKRYDSAYEYKQAKTEQRKKHVPFYLSYFVIGGVSLLLAILFAFL